MHPTMPVVCLSIPGCAGGSGLVVPASSFTAPVHSAAVTLLPAGLASCTGLYVAVRGTGGTGAARTYSGQRPGRQPRGVSFPQVSRHVEVQAGAYCKTVGSAYVGSNPTPATTSVNGPLAADSRLCGRFFSVPACVTLSRCRPLCRGVHGRIADGNRGQGAVCGTVGFARTATDEGRDDGRATDKGPRRPWCRLDVHGGAERAFPRPG